MNARNEPRDVHPDDPPRSQSAPLSFLQSRGNGDAVWQIRRRFQQVRALHQALSRSILHRKAMNNDEKRRGQTYLARGLPPPPPRATVRSVVLGQHLGAKTF